MSDDLRALLAKATPGPWNHLGYCGQDGVIQGPRQIPVASAIGGKTSGHTGLQCFDNAALIVALRNNATALLDERDALRAALEPFVRHGRAAGAFDGDPDPIRFYTDTGYREVPVADFKHARAAYELSKPTLASEAHHGE